MGLDSAKLDRYFAVRQLIDTGDLLEWRGTGLVARGIRLFTRREVNHSSLCVRMPYGYGEPRRFMIEADRHGLEFRLISRALESYDGKVWWYQLSHEYDHLRNDIGRWAFDALACNNGYDYWSLFAQAFGRVSLDGRRYFCSEFYDSMLVVHGIAPPDPAGARRPGEFEELGIFAQKVRIL